MKVLSMDVIKLLASLLVSFQTIRSILFVMKMPYTLPWTILVIATQHSWGGVCLYWSDGNI